MTNPIKYLFEVLLLTFLERKVRFFDRRYKICLTREYVGAIMTALRGGVKFLTDGYSP